MTSPINNLAKHLWQWHRRVARWLFPQALDEAALQPIPIRSSEARSTRRQGGRR